MEKTVIVAIITNLGTLIVLFWFLGRVQKLLREHPSQDQGDENKVDEGWHSWRFWLPSDDGEIGRQAQPAEGEDQAATSSGPGKSGEDGSSRHRKSPVARQEGPESRDEDLGLN